MLNLKLGAAVGLQNAGGSGRPAAPFSAASFGLDFGVAVTPDRRGYIVFPFQTLVGAWYSAIMFPVGFEYDFKLSRKGPYLTTRISGGYALVALYYQKQLLNFGVVIPELGVKYVYRKRWSFGCDAFSLPIGFGSDDSGVPIVAVFYRMMFYAGLNL